MSLRKVKIHDFLKERTDRFKPDEANELNLSRIEKIDFSGKIHLSDRPSDTRTAMILVKQGDLVISGINVQKGALAIYNFERDALATIHYSSFIYDITKIDITYLKWFLKSPVFVNLLKLNSGNGIKTEIKAKRFLDLEILLPDLDEQRETVKKIESVFLEVEEVNAIINDSRNLTTKLSEAILQEAIEGKLTKQWRGENNPKDSIKNILKVLKEINTPKLSAVGKSEKKFEIPESWIWCRLGEIIDEKPRNGYSPKAVEYVTNVKTLKLGATTKGVFNGNEFKYLDIEVDDESYLWLKPMDILIQRSNSLNYVGVSAIYSGGEKEFVYPDLMMKITISKPINFEYVFYVLSSQFIRNYFREMASGKSGSMPKINQPTVINSVIPLPPIEEQVEVTKIVKGLIAVCNQIDIQVSQFKDNMDQLIESILNDIFLNDTQGFSNMPSTMEKTDFSLLHLRLMNSYKFKTNSFMELDEILKENGTLSAVALWKMSKFENDIDAFYDSLKKHVEVDKTIVESTEKGFLELSK